MMNLDAIVTCGIVAAAAFYLYRKFAKSGQKGNCGCASGGGCCGKHDAATAAHSCGSKH